MVQLQVDQYVNNCKHPSSAVIIMHYDTIFDVVFLLMASHGMQKR